MFVFRGLYTLRTHGTIVFHKLFFLLGVDFVACRAGHEKYQIDGRMERVVVN